ncbi:MAG: hypothetical protein E7Z97_05915 [Propionibacteriaceae bacterium]|nr:hypothetical protein [Propionibacteriaceae bacterium]
MRPHTTPNTTKRTAVVATVLLSLVIGVALATAIWHRAAIGHRDGQAARETVEAYLTAVAEGDAETARGYLGEVDDDSLLTDEVLEESRAHAPMTDITVGRATKNWLEDGVYDVQVAYTLGEEVSTVMRVETAGGLVITSVSWLWLAEFTDVDFTVNGAIPATDEPNVFPGSYLLEASNEYLEIAGEPIAATDTSIAPYGPSVENELVVSEAGIQMFRGKVVAEATECLASTRLDPGCGIHAIPQYPDSVPECEEIGEDSVQRHLDAGQAARLETVTPEPDHWEPTIIKVLFTELGRFTVTVSCRTGDTWSSREIADYSQIRGLFFGSPSIDLTDPDLAVVWNR